MDPKRLEAFVTYFQAVAKRQFPHDEINLRIEDGKVKAKVHTRSSDPNANHRRQGEIAGFLHGMMKAPCLFSKADIQCAIYLATPDRPAEKLPE